MLIFNQDKDKLINMDRVVYIDIDLCGNGNSNSVYAYFEDYAPVLLGVFNTEEDARKCIKQIAETEGAVNVFYVPSWKED